mmetsp:Transcript_28164/g.71797  ORF Transcript_28164/g.71797 Transcript_28164/m.71797 type:complete len:561 (-) Transcript_28164:1472-3154(-)
MQNEAVEAPTQAPTPSAREEPSTQSLHHVVSFHESHEDHDKDPPCCLKFEPWFEKNVEPYVLVPRSRQNWLTFLAFWACVAGIVVWFSIWAFPRIVDNAFDPGVEWFQSKTTDVQLGVVCCLAICLFPVTIILPKDPFIWVVSVVFNFGEALAIVVSATTVGMIIPYLITRKWLRRYILRFLRRYRYTKAVLLGVRKAGPFKTVLVVRLGPVPYSITNYLMAVPEDMTFIKYMAASIPGKMPSNVLSVIFGRNLKGLAALLKGEHLPASQIVVNLVSLGCALIIVVGGFLYARRALKQLEAEAQAEEEAAQAAALAAAGGADLGPAEEGGQLQPGDAASPPSAGEVASGGSGGSTDADISIADPPGVKRGEGAGGDGVVYHLTASAVAPAAGNGAPADSTGSTQHAARATPRDVVVAAAHAAPPPPLASAPSWWRCCKVWPDRQSLEDSQVQGQAGGGPSIPVGSSRQAAPSAMASARQATGAETSTTAAAGGDGRATQGPGQQGVELQPTVQLVQAVAQEGGRTHQAEAHASPSLEQDISHAHGDATEHRTQHSESPEG